MKISSYKNDSIYGCVMNGNMSSITNISEPDDRISFHVYDRSMDYIRNRNRLDLAFKTDKKLNSILYIKHYLGSKISRMRNRCIKLSEYKGGYKNEEGW